MVVGAAPSEERTKVPEQPSPHDVLVEWYYNHTDCGEKKFAPIPPPEVVSRDELPTLLHKECIWEPGQSPIFKFKEPVEVPIYSWQDDTERNVALESFVAVYQLLSSESGVDDGWVRTQDILDKTGLTYIQYSTLQKNGLLPPARPTNFANGRRMINFRPINNTE